MGIKKYSCLVLCLIYFFSTSNACALAPKSRFDTDSLSIVPKTLTSNIDGKNSWYFLSGDKNPFTYMRTRDDVPGKVALEIGTVTNYISLFEFEGISDFSVVSASPKESDAHTGAEVSLRMLPTDFEATVNLKYLNDGRALRDLNRMFSGVDPRALKDILELLSRDDEPFMATPKYTLSADKRNLSVSVIYKSHLKDATEVNMTLPKGFVFVEMDEGVEKVISLKEVESLLGTDEQLRTSYENLIKKINDADEAWFAERNISYNKETREITLNQGRVAIRREGSSSSILNMKVEFKDNFNVRPESMSVDDIFTKDTLSLAQRLKDKPELFDLYSGALSLLKMLVTDNTVLAGVPNYITYFGRDTLYTSLFLFNHFTPVMREHFLQQVISRASALGECAHEIDTRYDHKDERHYDYRMADSDLIFSTSIMRYFDSSVGDMHGLEEFLNRKDSRNRFGTANGKVMTNNLNYVLSQLIDKELLSIKRGNDPSSGNWRDALNSLGRGKYPYDINCVWPQKIIYFMEKISKDENLKNLLLQYSEPGSVLSDYLNDYAKITALKAKWENTKQRFKMELDVAAWQKQLRNYYEDDHNDSRRQNMLTKMPIGKDADGEILYAYDFIYKGLIPKTLPNGEYFPEKFETYSMSLDAKGRTADVVHSDLSLAPLFYDNEYYEQEKFDKSHFANILKSYTLPLSLGGLGVYDSKNDFIGFVVANPMLADKDGYDLVLTPSEEANGINPKDLSPWQLLNPDSYHGMGAVWSFQKDFYTIARTKVGMDISVSDFNQLYSKEEQIRPEIFTVEYARRDFDLKYKSEIEGLSINPCQLWNTAIISVIKNHVQQSTVDVMYDSLSTLPLDESIPSKHIAVTSAYSS